MMMKKRLLAISSLALAFSLPSAAAQADPTYTCSGNPKITYKHQFLPSGGTTMYQRVITTTGVGNLSWVSGDVFAFGGSSYGWYDDSFGVTSGTTSGKWRLDFRYKNTHPNDGWFAFHAVWCLR